jgi:6-phosphogluconolactonase
MTAQLYIGTYEKPGGRGIYPLAVAADGSLEPGECRAPAVNSSFGAWSATSRVQYLVDECDSRLALWRENDGDWRQIERVHTAGTEPCYLALDEHGGRLAVANYRSGSLALFRLDANGWPVQPASSFQDSGAGPVNGRQEGPHVHCVRFGPDRHSLYAVDLGADHVLHFQLDGAWLGPARIAWRAPPGAGPRHLLFHPARPFALLISELASTLTLLAVTGETLEAIATCSTLPHGWAGANLGGHLEWPSTGRAYVSNRGHDSVALIEVDLERASLNPVQHRPSGGRSPRHFLLLEELRLLLVAHEKDGTVASFRIGEAGHLSATGFSIHVPGACFLFRVPA